MTRARAGTPAIARATDQPERSPPAIGPSTRPADPTGSPRRPPRRSSRRGPVRVHGPRATVVPKRRDAAASEPNQPPGGHRPSRRVRRYAGPTRADLCPARSRAPSVNSITNRVPVRRPSPFAAVPVRRTTARRPRSIPEGGSERADLYPHTLTCRLPEFEKESRLGSPFSPQRPGQNYLYRSVSGMRHTLFASTPR